MVADHIDHIRAVAGIDSVGLGSVDKFPALLAELARRGWSDDVLAKLAGRNLLRAMRAAEAVGAKLRAAEGPSFATIAALDGPAGT